MKEHNLAEDGKVDSPTEIKKSVWFHFNLIVDKEDNTEITSEGAKSSTEAFVEHAVVNGNVKREMTTFESGVEIEESTVECLIDTTHNPYGHDSVEHPKALEETNAGYFSSKYRNTGKTT